PPSPGVVRKVLLGDAGAGAGLTVYGRRISTQGPGQAAYLEALQSADLCIVTGTAGSGKTYLAVARGAQALQDEEVERLIFCRPAVESGERLGFLPGDVEEKMAPYFRPIRDALYRVLGLQRTRRLIASGRIEIAPLAFMRGRTLDDAFILLDEAQNTSVGQMRMFLTRLGVGSRAVVTGDPTQSDLPPGTESGLGLALERLGDVPGVRLVTLGREDVVRHPLVARIDEALGE
ncbi:PhoH family protein, partial [bacterium]|nr:PhoH family protein [bacterium]